MYKSMDLELLKEAAMAHYSWLHQINSPLNGGLCWFQMLGLHFSMEPYGPEQESAPLVNLRAKFLNLVTY